MRKRKICFLPMLIACLLLITGATAQAESEQSKAVQVTDNAGILDDSEERKLENIVEELELSTSWDVMLLSIDDAEGKTSERYAEEWFDSYTTSDDGVICLIDMDNREMAIRTFGEAYTYITDERLNEIFDDAYYSASDGNYFEVYETMLEGINKAYQRGIPDDTEIYDEDTGEVIGYYTEQKRITIIEALIAIVAALAAGGITMGVIVGKYRLKWGTYQYSYREHGSVELSRKKDNFVNQIVTHRRIPKSDSGGSGGKSRSTTHVGAGGRRSGGGSRKF